MVRYGVVVSSFESLRAEYPAVLTTKQVADILSLHPRTVMNMAGAGQLPASRIGRKFHFSRDDLIERLEADAG